MSKTIELSDHARWQGRRRGLDEATILRVAETPEQTIQVREGREVRQSRLERAPDQKSYLVRVVVDTHASGATVVTVYRTSDIMRYWRET